MGAVRGLRRPLRSDGVRDPTRLVQTFALGFRREVQDGGCSVRRDERTVLEVGVDAAGDADVTRVIELDPMHRDRHVVRADVLLQHVAARVEPDHEPVQPAVALDRPGRGDLTANDDGVGRVRLEPGSPWTPRVTTVVSTAVRHAANDQPAAGQRRLSCSRTHLRAVTVAVAFVAHGACREAVDHAPTTTRAPCDLVALRNRAAAVRQAVEAWAPNSGRVLDESRAVAGSIWRACPTLPDPLRVFLDRTVWHIGVIEGDDALADEFPGHTEIDMMLLPYFEERRALNSEICAGLQDIMPRIATAPPSQRRALILDACGLARSDLLSRDEVAFGGREDLIGLFVLDRWLTLTGGVATDDARTLVRALDVGRPRQRPRRDQLLPFAANGVDELPDQYTELLFVGPATIGLDYTDRASLVSLADGVVSASDLAGTTIPALVSPLGFLHESQPPAHDAGNILLMVDRTVPWLTLVAVVHTARIAGFRAMDLVFLSSTPPVRLHALSLEPAFHVTPASDGSSRIEVDIGVDELTMTCNRETRTWTTVDAFAADIARCTGPESGTMSIDAAPTIRIQRILEVALAGRRAGKRIGIESPKPR